MSERDNINEGETLIALWESPRRKKAMARLAIQNLFEDQMSWVDFGQITQEQAITTIRRGRAHILRRYGVEDE